MTDDHLNPPEINRELFQQIHDQISFHPDSHEQASWESGCGTTRCVAGWAIHLKYKELLLSGEVSPEDTENICGPGGLHLAKVAVARATGPAPYAAGPCDSRAACSCVSGAEHFSFSEVAGHLLGLTRGEAAHLFLDSGNTEAARLVERYALKGRDDG